MPFHFALRSTSLVRFNVFLPFLSRAIFSTVLVPVLMMGSPCARAASGHLISDPVAPDRSSTDQEKNASAMRPPETGALLAQPASGPALEVHADALVRQHQYLEAIHLYEAIGAPSAIVLNKIGIAYEKMRLYDAAKVNFERALSQSPKLSGPENNLGTVYYATGDLRRAEQHYKRALKLDPRNASIYNNLGTLYFMRRKIHKGMEAYQQAQSLDHDIFERDAENRITTEGSRESRALINFYLAETCAEAGMKAAALTYLQRAVDAGFHDRTKLREDRHFDAVRETPEFKSLLVEVARVDAVAQPVP